MRKTLLMTTGLAWLALTAAASAATVTITPETALSPNYFVGQSVGSNTFSVGTDKSPVRSRWNRGGDDTWDFR
jgi:hypothetical protein